LGAGVREGKEGWITGEIGGRDRFSMAAAQVCSVDGNVIVKQRGKIG